MRCQKASTDIAAFGHDIIWTVTAISEGHPGPEMLNSSQDTFSTEPTENDIFPRPNRQNLTSEGHLTLPGTPHNGRTLKGGEKLVQKPS